MVIQPTSSVDVVEQEVEVDEARVGRPRDHGVPNSVVTRVQVDSEQSLQVVACAHVVAGEHGEPPEPAEQRVLGRPSADAAEPLEGARRFVVVDRRQPLEVEPAMQARRQLRERTSLGGAEPEVDGGEIRGIGEGMRRIGIEAPVPFGEPIEQPDADGERELLAGDGVGQAFEHGRIARRL